MNNIYGIKGIAIKTFELGKYDSGMENVDVFLKEHDGNIIDIQTTPMAYAVVKIIIIYKKRLED